MESRGIGFAHNSIQVVEIFVYERATYRKVIDCHIIVYSICKLLFRDLKFISYLICYFIQTSSVSLYSKWYIARKIRASKIYFGIASVRYSEIINDDAK